MKNKTIYLFRNIILIVLFALLFEACNETNDLGLELLPKEDLVSVKSTIIKDDISAYIYREDSIKTDEASRSLLGSLNDPVFGNTTINFATQFRLQYFPEFGTNPVADSIKLYMYYRLIYGDTSTIQRFRVYELESPIDIDEDYTQETDLKSMSFSQLLGEVEYKPRVRQDSVTADTFYQLITIPIDNSLGQKLVNADSTEMANNDAFLNYFKGLYIETEKLDGEGGTILTLEAASNDNFQGSALLLWYNNDENKAETEPDTLSFPYVISEFSARVNQITHDYSQTLFASKFNDETTEDSLMYIQANGGIESKIYIHNLSDWSDSTNTLINKAELVFQVDTVLSELDKYAPPRQLLLTVISEDGTELLPIDYVINPNFYGGVLEDDNTYRFNITKHVQQIIEGEIENNGFYLTTALKSSQANRVVLKGSTSKTGVRLIITYAKYLQ